MERRSLGRTGLEVSVLGFGGSEIGYEGASLKIVEALLGAALDAGLNVIDTAECYFESERLIGRASGHRRKEFLLFTKCGHDQGIGLPEWTPRLIEASVERSLRLLRTDHVDLLQLHSCDEKLLRKGDVIEAAERLRAAGKARFIGYSGDGADAYHHPYWERLLKLDYPFLKGPLAASIGTALRFTLAVRGVATAIVGTKMPGRWEENAALLKNGTVPPAEHEAIRARWRAVAPAGWAGQR